MPRPAEILASIRDQLRGSKSVALGQFQIINKKVQCDLPFLFGGPIFNACPAYMKVMCGWGGIRQK